MRTALLAMVTAAGIGLAVTSTTSAAPVSGLVLSGQSTDSVVTTVGHCRYSHWRRWCHHHHWRWSRRW